MWADIYFGCGKPANPHVIIYCYHLDLKSDTENQQNLSFPTLTVRYQALYGKFGFKKKKIKRWIYASSVCPRYSVIQFNIVHCLLGLKTTYQQFRQTWFLLVIDSQGLQHTLLDMFVPMSNAT